MSTLHPRARRLYLPPQSLAELLIRSSSNVSSESGENSNQLNLVPERDAPLVKMASHAETHQGLTWVISTNRPSSSFHPQALEEKIHSQRKRGLSIGGWNFKDQNRSGSDMKCTGNQCTKSHLRHASMSSSSWCELRSERVHRDDGTPFLGTYRFGFEIKQTWYPL
jgi:hypothetical protein